MNGTNNRKRRFKKQWWNNELTKKWNSVCIAEKDYVSSKNGILKTQLRITFVNKRKDFDKLVQKCKRQYWYRSQEELIRLSDTDSKQFWRKIGKIGIGNQRQSNIPNEITLDDGSITDNSDTVLNKWKNCFQTLLNLNVDSNSDRIENYSIKENIVCNELDDEITINEV